MTNRRDAWLARARAGTHRLVRALRHVAPVRSYGTVDTVADLVAGPTVIQGWVRVPGERIDAVVVTVDDLPAALAQPDPERTDLARARRGVFARRGVLTDCGWRAVLDLEWAPGRTLRIGARAVTRGGIVETLTPRVVKVPARPEPQPPPAVGVDIPTDGASWGDALLPVRGWILGSSVPARVRVMVRAYGPEFDGALGAKLDGKMVYDGSARLLSAPRPDLAERSDEPWAPMGSFEADADVGTVPEGTRLRITAALTAADGEVTVSTPVEVRVGPRATAPPFDAAWCATLAARTRAVGLALAGHASPRLGADDPVPVRLLAVTHSLALGGGQLFLVELLTRLLEELDVACLVLAPEDGPLRTVLENLGAVVHVTGPIPILSPERYEAALLEQSHLVADFDANVALVNSVVAFSGADLGTRLGIPTVWTIHESYDLESLWFAAYGARGLHPYIRTRAESALEGVQAVAFEADATRELYERGAPRRNHITIRYGVPIHKIDEYARERDRDSVRAKLGLEPEQVMVLCMGTYEPRKSQGMLALAFARVAPHFPDAVLALVGDNAGAFSDGLHALVDRLDARDRIRLVPVVEDTFAWYRAADIIVSASDVESMPRSLLEAMAFGVPVIAADVYGLSEMIEADVTGMLVPPRDLDALAAALLRMLEIGPRSRAGIGESARVFVHARHDSSGYAGAYRELLRGLVADADADIHDLLAAYVYETGATGGMIPRR